MRNINNDLVLAKYIKEKYAKNIIDMLADISSKTIDYHCLTINFSFDSNITFKINKSKKKLNDEEIYSNFNA